MNNLDQARKWAKEVSEEYFTYIPDDSRAAIKVIQSLPDQWIDAEKVREIYDRYRANETTLHEAFRAAVALTTPSLPTLAEMTPEEREACQWMQATVLDEEDTMTGVIQNIYRDVVWVMFKSGRRNDYRLNEIIPRPDLPRLEWPGSGDTPTVAEQENVAPDQVVAKDVCNNEDGPLPRPEDIPAGEAWLVGIRTGNGIQNDQEFFGIRSSGGTWELFDVDEGWHSRWGIPSEITLISRLVPEDKP